MEKITFKDLPDTTTPINATNLNAIQTNAENAINAVVISDSGWINFDLLSGWTYNAGQNRPQYRKIGKVVYFKGLLYKSGTGVSSSVALLPEGYRPTTVANNAYLYISARRNDGTLIALQITPAGYLYITVSTTDGQFISLDGLSFCID